MWKYVHVWITLVFALFTADAMGTVMRTRENIYIDVLKNITNVNSRLDSLLDSYKKLKSDYEFHAASVSELSAESVSDEESREISSTNLQEDRKTRYRKIKEVLTDRGEDVQPVTQMILIEEEFPKESNDKVFEDGTNENQDSTSDKSETDSSDTGAPEHTARPILRSSHGIFERVGRHRNNDSSSHRTLLIFITNQNNEPKQSHVKNRQDLIDTDPESEEINTFKSQILRDAYGTACLKVAVYRCYKTLLEVNKIVCRSDFRCGGSFKEHFKKNSNAGCRKEFNIPDMKDPEENDTNEYRHYEKRYTKYGGPDDGFDDITRTSNNVNYYDLCLPVMMSDFTNNSKELIPTRDFKIEPINFLRNRYESECRRMSKERCVRACHFASEETCKQHSCPHQTRRQFDRACSKQCRHAFLSNAHSDSDSDSDNDSDSDSDDSDDSESSGWSSDSGGFSS